VTLFGIDDPAVEQAVRAYVKLMRASRAVVARIEPLLAAHCLTPTQLGVLEALLHKGPMTHRDLGRRVLTSAGNMTDVVDKLEHRCLVRRVRSPSDRRSVRVELTEAGEVLIKDLFPRHARDIASAMSGLDAARLGALDTLLRDLGMGARRPEEESAPLEGETASS
jgi:MarR family 2-MHQ and catechol resistance regulon transcriptional repressor